MYIGVLIIIIIMHSGYTIFYNECFCYIIDIIINKYFVHYMTLYFQFTFSYALLEVHETKFNELAMFNSCLQSLLLFSYITKLQQLRVYYLSSSKK